MDINAMKPIHVETLMFLHVCSPVWTGDFPSKEARNELADAGFTQEIPLRGSFNGYWVLTLTGLRCLLNLYGEDLEYKAKEFEEKLNKRKKESAEILEKIRLQQNEDCC